MSFPASTIETRLRERAIPTHRLPVGDNAVVIISEYGARVYGPFFGDDTATNWVPKAFERADDFAELHASGQWNVGGERIWVGPEIAYMIPDRADYWGSYTMPADIDPGSSSLSVTGGVAEIRRNLTFPSFLTGQIVELEMTVTVESAPDPLRNIRNFVGYQALGVHYGGYTSTVRLRNVGDAAVSAESWNLNQVPGGGSAMIAATRDVQVTDYYEPVGDLLQRIGGGVRVQLPGSQRFKIGFAAAQTVGLVGHMRSLEADRCVLTIRRSPVDASADYSEEPDFAPGVRGDALHLYNDDGGLGGFAELEARGTPLTDERADAASIDRFTTWVFVGERDSLAVIAQELLGIELDETGGTEHD